MKFEEFLTEAALASVKDVEIDTRQYEFTHGNKPRGRGNWVIGLKKEVDLTKDKEGTDYVNFNGEYALAATKAKRVAKERGVRTVYVQT